MAFIRNNRFFIPLAGALLIGVLFAFLYQRQVPAEGYGDGVLVGAQTSIAVSIAETMAEREQGLSGTDTLPEGAGKLFIFDDSALYGFWMKDMRYGIDIIWLDDSMTIVGITPNLQPETYPEVFFPPSAIRFVLEVPAGFSTAHALTVGQTFTLVK